MSTILENLNSKAIQLGIPLGVHLDVTWRCNERCVHCYLDHDDLGEMSYDEIEDLMTQMAAAGVFFLTISGGEPMLRKRYFSDHTARARVDLQCEAQDQRDPDPGKRSRADPRTRRRYGSGQHLLPSPRGSRRDHQGQGLARALARRDPLHGLARAQGHDGQRRHEADPI